MLQLLAQLEGVPCLPVHLVDEGEDGDVPQAAHLKELPGLGLHALGGVDDHHCGVGGHQGAVGVLGEVLVAGGVQNVDAEALVLELHHRGGHRDAPLLLDLHPVRRGRPGVLLPLHLPRLGDGPTVQEELLRQGGLARVRVGDDGKGPPALDFRFVVRQKGPLPCFYFLFGKLLYHKMAEVASKNSSCIGWAVCGILNTAKAKKSIK